MKDGEARIRLIDMGLARVLPKVLETGKDMKQLHKDNVNLKRNYLAPPEGILFSNVDAPLSGKWNRDDIRRMNRRLFSHISDLPAKKSMLAYPIRSTWFPWSHDDYITSLEAISSALFEGRVGLEQLYLPFVSALDSFSFAAMFYSVNRFYDLGKVGGPLHQWFRNAMHPNPWKRASGVAAYASLVKIIAPGSDADRVCESIVAKWVI